MTFPRLIHARSTFAMVMLLLVLRSANAAVVPGHVEAWGRNLFGEATPPPGLEGVIAVAGGSTHSLALLTNGTVVAWGSNENGESSVPAGLSNVVAIAANAFSAAVKADGTVVIWGSARPVLTNVPPAAVRVTAVALGWNAVLALRSDRTVVAWGQGGETNLPSNLSNVVQIAALNGHCLALTADGLIVGWGNDFYGQASHPPGLTNVLMVGAGQAVSMALKTDGTLFRWGSPFEQPDLPPDLTGLVDFDLGFQHALALRTNGTVVEWGANFAEQGSVPPLLNGVTAISAGGNHNLVVTARPVIQSITPPFSTSAGADATLTVTASGQALSYQWQHKGMNLPAETNSSLTIRNIGPERAGMYGVYVANPHGYNFAATSVSLPPPTITTQPQSRTVYRGERVTFSVVGSGFPPFTYQWARNGTVLTNETDATLVLTPLGREDSAIYRVTVTDVAGSTVTSSNAVLTVIDPRPQSVAFRPALDTSIYSAGVNPKGTDTILSGTRQNGIRDRGLLRFDLSLIPTNAVIDGASLRLRVVQTPRSPAGGTFHLHRMLQSWGAEATWLNAASNTLWAAPGAAAGTDYATSGIPGTFMFGSGDYLFVSTNLVLDIAAWINAPAANHGWILITDAENTPSSALHFGSSESANPPDLLISYSILEEPPTITATREESGNLVFEVQGSAGWFYSIEEREFVDRGIWTGFTNAAAGAGQIPIVITVPMTNSHQFFRAFRY